MKMTREEAIAFATEKRWEKLTLLERANFQLRQELLCMPFGVFHEAVEHALGRPVWTHEFANGEALLKELEGRKEAPSMTEIIEQLPQEKLIIVEVQK